MKRRGFLGGLLAAPLAGQARAKGLSKSPSLEVDPGDMCMGTRRSESGCLTIRNKDVKWGYTLPPGATYTTFKKVD